MQSEEITLTSRLGRFSFNRNVILSHAKLIRDTCTGQFFKPSADCMTIRDEEDCEVFIRSIGGPFRNVPFSIVFSEDLY